MPDQCHPPGPEVRELLQQGRAALARFDTPSLDAELLLADVLACTRAGLICRREQRVAPDDAARFSALVNARAEGRPLAQLRGRQEFWSLELSITEAVLVPRPETELLVSLALEHCPLAQPSRILDLGTGSGAVALALATERPLASLLAVDSSEAALAVAEANRARLRLSNLRLQRTDWYTGLNGRFDLVVSNPPYIRDDDPVLAGPGLRFEPRTALAAGPDGLAALRQIAAGAVAHLVPAGWLLLEHGATQGQAIRTLLVQAGLRAVSTTRDLADHERVTMGQRGTDSDG